MKEDAIIVPVLCFLDQKFQLPIIRAELPLWCKVIHAIEFSSHPGLGCPCFHLENVVLWQNLCFSFQKLHNKNY